MLYIDSRAWQIALEEARAVPGVPRNASTVYMPAPGVTTYSTPYYGLTQYPGYTYPPGQTTGKVMRSGFMLIMDLC